MRNLKSDFFWSRERWAKVPHFWTSEQVYKTVPFKSGENVRILEEKDTFSKGKNKFSNDTYKVSDKIGYKIAVKNDDDNKLIRKFKPSELLKINKVDKPISKSYIEEEKEDKKKGKIINSLVRNVTIDIIFPWECFLNKF